MVSMMFVDEVSFVVKAGRGGKGCESYNKRPDRKLVPNGGGGGAGGDAVVRTSRETGSLSGLKSKRLLEAESGEGGKGNKRYGRNGRPLVISVPCGTTVFDRARQLLLRDLVEVGDEVVVAKGGRGGAGNHNGGRSRPGEEGELIDLALTFSIVADIFLVGLPNSGKTALLRRLTGAHVEPTDYPFATRTPCLGTYESASGALRLCELPAVYERSEAGGGLGSAFLKHLKRARLVFLIVEPVSSFAKTPAEGVRILLRAIEKTDPHFLQIPRFIVVNKMDRAPKKKLARVRDPVLYVSAESGAGVARLMKQAVSVVEGKSTCERMISAV
jgi:GTP-binding protein